MAVGIAHKKAVDAIRSSQKGLRGTDHRPQLRLVSGDAEREGPGGETEPAIFEVLPSNWGDPEAESLELEYVVELRNLAREVLNDRNLKIFFAIHFQEYSRREIGEQLGLTSQRIGQIYRAALRSIGPRLNHPFKLDNKQQGGNDDH